jgi:hypothetical protein
VLWHQGAHVFASDNKYSGLAVMRRDVVQLVRGGVPSVDKGGRTLHSPKPFGTGPGTVKLSRSNKFRIHSLFRHPLQSS